MSQGGEPRLTMDKLKSALVKTNPAFSANPLMTENHNSRDTWNNHQADRQDQG